MNLDTYKLIWLFPIAFILHDFEELILFEPWLKKNAGLIMERIRGRVPAFVERQISIITQKTTTQFAMPIYLIFILTCISSLLAAEYGSYAFFLAASGLFFLHGFMHIGQALLLRKYIPAVITSVLVVIPYGIVLFWNLLDAGIVKMPELLVFFVIAIVVGIPFILLIHVIGEYIYKKAVQLLVGL